jgi:Sulfotransferase family
MHTFRLRRPNSSKWWAGRSTLACATIASIALVFFCGRLVGLGTDSLYANVGALDMLSFSSANMSSSQKTLGREIVEKAYEESYAYLVEQCGNLNETGLQMCLSRLYQLQTQANSPLREKWPWWFQTLIRDARVLRTGLFGTWHYLQFTDPTMQVCVYEKGGTKMWRSAHCQYMQRNGVNLTGSTPTNCYQRQGNLQTTNVERSVFLRDPLERYLSGFLDKCAYKPHRQLQPHCRPSIIFQNPNNTDVNEFLDQPQTLFKVHVDVSPVCDV